MGKAPTTRTQTRTTEGASKVNPGQELFGDPRHSSLFPLSLCLHYAQEFVDASSSLFVSLRPTIVRYSPLSSHRRRCLQPEIVTRTITLSTATECIVTTQSFLLHLRAPEHLAKTTSRNRHNLWERARLSSLPRRIQHNPHFHSRRAQTDSINRPHPSYKSRGVRQEQSASLRRLSCRNRTRNQCAT
jgi:hypothetical protein